MVMGPRFAIFTEDSGKDAVATIEALLRRLLPRIEPLAQPQNVPPMTAPHGEVAQALRGHRWKDRKADVPRRALVRDLARRLSMGDFVVFHCDGDAAWGGTCPHDEPIDALMADVARLLNRPVPAHFLRLVPHYSIESWLYLNRAAAERLVEQGKALPEALEWLDANACAARGYDHVTQPKRHCPLHDRYNRLLAEDDWPRDEAATRSPSWAQLEADWSANPTLRAALRATNPWATASSS
ncbi:MAG: hypothetical protein R3F65_13280 [bacterium]